MVATGMSELNVVTGAFGYTGKYITLRLVTMGKTVRTLTGHPNRPNPFGQPVEVCPYNFDKPQELAKSLEGVTTLYNTYWVRFAYGQVTFEGAVTNTIKLLRGAEDADVRKFVHLSITNPSGESRLAYFRGKGVVEKAIRESRLLYAIIRPALIFGPEDILFNTIAWLLRRFPVFAIPGSGDYQLQPVFVEDVAEIAVTDAQEEDNVIINAAGPDVYTFEELVRRIAKAVRFRAGSTLPLKDCLQSWD